MRKQMDDALPGFVIGAAFGALFSSALAVVAGCAVLGGVITYVVLHKQAQKQ